LTSAVDVKPLDLQNIQIKIQRRTYKREEILNMYKYCHNGSQEARRGAKWVRTGRAHKKK